MLTFIENYWDALVLMLAEIPCATQYEKCG